MTNQANSGNQEFNPLISDIIKLTSGGMTDEQIGRIHHKHYKTIAYHRNKHGIDSGRSHKAELAKQRRAQAVNKRTYKMIVDKEQSLGTKIKHGLNAYAPITCRGTGCPYRKTCDIPDNDLAVGEPCVIESAIITTLSEQYGREFQITDNDIANLARLRQLIEIDIKLIRCDRLMAQNPELVYTICEDEQPINRLNPVAYYDLFLMRERSKILNELRAAIETVNRSS